MPLEQVVDGLKVQAAINACYLWRGHVIATKDVEAFLAAHDLFVENEKIGMRGVFEQDGSPFFIVSAVESPYGLEIGQIHR